MVLDNILSIAAWEQMIDISIQKKGGQTGVTMPSSIE